MPWRCVTVSEQRQRFLEHYQLKYYSVTELAEPLAGALIALLSPVPAAQVQAECMDAASSRVHVRRNSAAPLSSRPFGG